MQLGASTQASWQNRRSGASDQSVRQLRWPSCCHPPLAINADFAYLYHLRFSAWLAARTRAATASARELKLVLTKKHLLAPLHRYDRSLIGLVAGHSLASSMRGKCRVGTRIVEFCRQADGGARFISCNKHLGPITLEAPKTVYLGGHERICRLAVSFLAACVFVRHQATIWGCMPVWHMRPLS